MNYNLQKAHKVKNDEFYTHLSDIDNELQHYKDIFAGKIIYCNCDNPTKSNFVKWFYRRFNMLHLKRLIVTAHIKIKGVFPIGAVKNNFPIKKYKNGGHKHIYTILKKVKI